MAGTQAVSTFHSNYLMTCLYWWNISAAVLKGEPLSAFTNDWYAATQLLQEMYNWGLVYCYLTTVDFLWYCLNH